MSRREFIAQTAGAVAWPLSAVAQQVSKPWRIGIVRSGREGQPDWRTLDTVLEDSLSRTGYMLGWRRKFGGNQRRRNLRLCETKPKPVVSATVEITPCQRIARRQRRTYF